MYVHVRMLCTPTNNLMTKGLLSQRSLMYFYMLLVDGRWQIMSYLCLISSNDIILSELGR